MEGGEHKVEGFYDSEEDSGKEDKEDKGQTISKGLWGKL